LIHQSLARLSTLARSLTLGIALSLLLAACGGGSDSKDSQSNPPAPVQVPSGPSNSAPTIQGSPAASIAVGQKYSFTPVANDTNGDHLTFSVANLPSWATFDQASGQVSGTPSAADVGSYAGIKITVSDGTAATSLAAFTVAVTQIGSGSATLSWVAPTENTDGSALADLSGYVVHYGQTSASLDKTVMLSNASLTRYVVENLSTGTWFFAIEAVNGAGVHSNLSTVVSKAI
jgi:hypothetical protein